MLMDIPVFPADGETVAVVVEDHPRYRPANGGWICGSCGCGNIAPAEKCSECRTARTIWTDDNAGCADVMATAILSKVEQERLEQLLLVHGTMTAEEALTLASEAEEKLRSMGPFNTLRGGYTQQSLTFARYASLLEKVENANKKTA